MVPGPLGGASRAAQQLLTEGEGGITTRIIALHALGFVALGRGRVDAATELLGEARASGEEMRELQRFSPAALGARRVRAAAGDSAAAVALTELGYDASHEVLEAANLFPFLVTGTRARLEQRDPTGARDWVERVPPTCAPGACPACCPPSTTPRAWSSWPRAGPARRATCSAPPQAGWSARGRWWESQWCALDLARCAVASNRRTEAVTLVEGVREAASAVAAAPLLEAAAAIGSRLDRHDAPQPWSPLTRREFEVARLVARGLTNREIAEELRITPRTAGSHLEHIRAKLGVGRRSEIAAWVTLLETGGQIDA